MPINYNIYCSIADCPMKLVCDTQPVILLTHDGKMLSLCLGTMVLSAVCHDSCNMIAALADGKFTVWYYPNVVFVDKELLPRVVIEKGGLAPSTTTLLRSSCTCTCILYGLPISTLPLSLSSILLVSPFPLFTSLCPLFSSLLSLPLDSPFYF